MTAADTFDFYDEERDSMTTHRDGLDQLEELHPFELEEISDEFECAIYGLPLTDLVGSDEILRKVERIKALLRASQED